MAKTLKRAFVTTLAWLLAEPFSTSAQPPPTIDKVDLRHKLDGQAIYYPPGAAPKGSPDRLSLPGLVEYFHLSDGSSESQGGGGYRVWSHTIESVAADDGMIEFTLSHPPGDRVLDIFGVWVGSGTTRYATGEFETTESLVLRAAAGSTTATLSTWFRLTNVPIEPNWPDQQRLLYSCDVGDFVPVELTYTLHFTQFSAGNTTFTPTTFDQPFVYSIDGFMNFNEAIKVPEPSCIGLVLFVGVALLSRQSAGSRTDTTTACPQAKSPGKSV